MTAQLLIIDPQNDFCDIHGAALPVTGADADMRRLGAFIGTAGARVQDVVVTMDSHPQVAIERPGFWRKRDGTLATPFTEITAAQVRAGDYSTVDAGLASEALAYLDALEAGNRYRLMVWTTHCVEGTWGHQMHESIASAVGQWESQTARRTITARRGATRRRRQHSDQHGTRSARRDVRRPHFDCRRGLQSLRGGNRPRPVRWDESGKAEEDRLPGRLHESGGWLRSRADGAVPRCCSPRRADHVGRRGPHAARRVSDIRKRATMTTTKPVITSLLETDLYKFTMWQTLLHHFPANSAEYRFVCRNTPAYPLAELEGDVNRELDALCGMTFTEEELQYLGSLRFMKSDFIDFLRVFRFHRPFIQVGTEGDTLTVVAKGPQVHVMAFEIYVLAIVNELYFRRFAADAALETGRQRLREKVRMLGEFASGLSMQPKAHGFDLFDFGLRRRYSGAWHDEVVATLQLEAPFFFKGTSNVHLARKYGLVPMGTMAHEYLQTFQAVDVQLKLSQKAALETWVQEYRGDLGVALTDVVGMDAFLADFDLYFAKLFDGLRHDSGDPVVWGEKALALSLIHI